MSGVRIDFWAQNSIFLKSLKIDCKSSHNIKKCSEVSCLMFLRSWNGFLAVVESACGPESTWTDTAPPRYRMLGRNKHTPSSTRHQKSFCHSQLSYWRVGIWKSTLYQCSQTACHWSASGSAAACISFWPGVFPRLPGRTCKLCRGHGPKWMADGQEWRFRDICCSFFQNKRTNVEISDFGLF